MKVEPTAPPDPVTMYESVRSRILALEEEEVTVEEEERRLGTCISCRSGFDVGSWELIGFSFCCFGLNRSGGVVSG